MNRDQIDDDDDDFEIINGRKVLKDGRALRTSISMMDAVQREVALSRGHRPGFITDDADNDDAHQDAEDARDEYIRYLQDAHRTPDTIREAALPKSRLASKAEAEAAYRERSEWLMNAYKNRQP